MKRTDKRIACPTNRRERRGVFLKHRGKHTIAMRTYQEFRHEIDAAIADQTAALIALNDDLADHPELSGQEYESSRKIVSLLKDRGYQVEYPFAGMDTAFRGIFGNNDHKYKIAVLVEYDALPQIGHACGHCLSGSVSLLAGFSVRQLQDELNADVHLIGTPSEEGIGMKNVMVEQGIFDGYHMAMMVHMYDQNVLAPRLQALNGYMYEFYGKAAHASSSPWDGANAFNAAQLMFHAMDMLRQHVTPDVRMHGIIRNGGQAPNIVPEKVSAEVFVRAMDRDYLNDLIRKVDDCARGAAIATQTSWDKYPTTQPYHNLLSNPVGEAALREVFEELGLPLNGDPEKIFGSSDAGNVSFVCPTFHPCLQVADKGVAIHTRAFAENMKSDRAHQALADGAKLIAHQIAKVFGDPDRAEAMLAAQREITPLQR